MKTVDLYRPVGEKEMILIADANYQCFPPRLGWQPIFYPVLNEEYAAEIASRWNTNDEAGNYLGFVTKFSIPLELFESYEVQNVGSAHHNELWVLAEDLAMFNEEIQGKIEVLEVFVGEAFKKAGNEEMEALINRLNK